MYNATYMYTATQVVTYIVHTYMKTKFFLCYVDPYYEPTIMVYDIHS